MTTTTTFAVGDYVHHTAILTDDGIEFVTGFGVVIEASNDVYVVQTGRTRAVVTGPGYIFRATQDENPDLREQCPDIGKKYVIDNNSGGIPDTLIGVTGIVTGTYSGSLLQITVPRERQQYAGVFPGSWAVSPDQITEVDDDAITFATKERLIGKQIRVLRGSWRIQPIPSIHTVTSVFYAMEPGKQKIDGITPGVTIDGLEDNWVWEYELVKDGETLTVSDPIADEPLPKFKAGDRVVIVNRGEGEYWEGVRGVYVGPEGGSTPSLRHTVNTDLHGEAHFMLHQIAPEPATEGTVTQAEYDAVVAERDRLRQEKATLDAQFLETVEIMSTRMNEEARSRGWCGEFNRIISEVNGDLPLYKLNGGKQDYEVTWEDVFTVTVQRCMSFSAESEEDAIEQAQEVDAADSYAIREAISNGDYSFNESDNYEANEE